MKKVLSLALALILAFSVVPAAFAATHTENFTDTRTLDDGDIISGQVTITPTGFVTVPQGAVVTIAPGASLTVNGNLVVNGELVISAGAMLVANATVTNTGTVTNDGTISNKNNVYNGETGILRTKVTIPATNPNDSAHPYHVRVASTDITTDEAYFADMDAAYENSVLNQGFNGYVKDGDALYFTLDFEDEAVDPDKFVVNVNGIRLYRDRGTYKLIPDNMALAVSYGDYVRKNLLKQIKITLPYGEGYRVVAYGTTLEEATEENIEYVYVDYGTSLSFRVDIFEGWQDSDVVVTIGGLDPTTQPEGSSISGPDQYGYYTISNITDAKAAEGAYDIYVVGVVADETQALIMRIMNTIRTIIETIMDVFSTFFGMLGGLGGGSTTTP